MKRIARSIAEILLARPFAFAILSVIVLCSCGATKLTPADSLVVRLQNRGPVALSSDNPYLAANLLLTREMEQSPEIKGFIRHRGAPAALEIKANWLENTFIYFYYPENREEYSLEDSHGVWIIRGPTVIDREKMKEVAALTRNVQGAPKLAPSDEKQTAEEGPATPAPRAKPAAPPETPSGSFNSFYSAAGPGAAPSQPAYGRQSSTQEDEFFVKDLLAQFGSHTAELSPKGDVVHYITVPGETLMLIARWYTFDRQNASRIARINRLTNPDRLSIGDQVIIPSYLIRNKSRLTEEAVRALASRN